MAVLDIESIAHGHQKGQRAVGNDAKQNGSKDQRVAGIMGGLYVTIVAIIVFGKDRVRHGRSILVSSLLVYCIVLVVALKMMVVSSVGVSRRKTPVRRRPFLSKNAKELGADKNLNNLNSIV